MTLRPRSTVVGLFGDRKPFVAGRLAAYRILNAPASAIHPAQREAGREGRADAPRSPVGSPPIFSTPYGWYEDVIAAQRRLEEELRG